LISQDSSSYGADLGNEDNLVELLKRLDISDMFPWIRVMYMYPSGVSDKLIDVIAESRNILPYFDIPFQHSHPDILKKMHRPGSGEEYIRLINKIRSRIPDAIFRSSFIAGFYGETDETVKHLSDFLDEAKILNVGVFAYWDEEGTYAFENYKNAIREGQRSKWRNQLMKKQAKISARILRGYVGKELDVIVEGLHPESDLILVGRFYGQAPEVDGTVIITDGIADRGDIVKVRIEESFEYDMSGKII